MSKCGRIHVDVNEGEVVILKDPAGMPQELRRAVIVQKMRRGRYILQTLIGKNEVPAYRGDFSALRQSKKI